MRRLWRFLTAADRPAEVRLGALVWTVLVFALSFWRAARRAGRSLIR